MPAKLGASLAEILDRGARTRVLVVIERQRAVVVEDRHERRSKRPSRDRRGGTVLAVDAELVALLAGEALDSGDEVGEMPCGTMSYWSRRCRCCWR
jgi:hypothetical protein